MDAAVDTSSSTSPSSPIEYPSIDPTSFDLIVCGTGLPESLLVAAASFAGKSVLHVDSNPFYGSHFSSLSPSDLPSFLLHHSSSSSASGPTVHHDSTADSPYEAVQLRRRPLYSDVAEISGEFPSEMTKSGAFILDLAGPRVLYCADAMTDLILRSGVFNLVNFKSVDAALMYWEGKLWSVPDSRQAIFKDRSLGLVEKNRLMGLLKIVQQQLAPGRSDVAEGESKPANRGLPEDLEVPFVDFLRQQGLSPRIRAMILYAISLADYDQDDARSCKRLLTTKEGIEKISLHLKSLSRFPDAVGQFIYPMYGNVELPQAFCYYAAVRGALSAVLRMPVLAVLIDKETKKYKGIRLASGQDILSNHLIMDPSYEIPPSISYSNFPDEMPRPSNFQGQVARGVCITTSSLLPDSLNVFVAFPPRSLFSEQSTTIRALQLSSNLGVSPPGFFVINLSTPCDDASLGREYITAAIKALFPASGTELDGTNEDNGGSKPALKWSIVFVQDLKQVVSGTVCSCPMPDENFDYGRIVESTKELFASIYSQEEPFLETPASDNLEEDGNSSE